MATERTLFSSLIPRREGSPQEAPIAHQELPSYRRHIREFNLPPGVENDLDTHQRRTLAYLVRAARRWADIYALQESDDPREPFWPKGVTRKQIREAEQIDPEISSPYTIVKYDESGQLRARPMHEVYAQQIKELGIIRLLRDAANETGKGKNRDFKLQAYLRAKARSLETGDFKASERLWLEREDEPDVDIFLGFYDTYSDEFMNTKYAAEASIGILDRQATYDSQWFKNALLDWWEKETGIVAPRVNVRVDHTRIQAGQVAKYEWIGGSFPCQMDWRAEMGSKFIIWEPVFEEKFRHRKLPALREFIDPEKIQGITDSFTRVATLRKHIAHEIGHSLVPGKDIQKRLQNNTAWIKELYCELLALIGYRAIKDISLRESEVAMAMALADGYLEYEDRRSRPEYHTASTILITHCLQSGSIRIEEGRYTWHETPLIFEDLSFLFSEVQEVLINGKRKNAQQLQDKYFNPSIYRPLMFGESFTNNGEQFAS